MTQSYYDKNGQPISHEEWQRRFDAEHRVLSATVDEISIDTLWFGIDYGSGSPIMFSTQVSYGTGDVDYEEFWPTLPIAIAGHDQVLAMIRSGKRPVNAHL